MLVRNWHMAEPLLLSVRGVNAAANRQGKNTLTDPHGLGHFWVAGAALARG